MDGAPGLAILAGAAALGALAQSASGVGIALLCGPAMLAALGPWDGARATVAISLALNLALLAWRWPEAEWRRALPALLPAVAAAWPAALAVHRLGARAATVAAATVLLAGLAAVGCGARLPWRAGFKTTALAGLASAGGNAAAGLSGPTMLLCATAGGWDARRLPATLQAYFLLLNCATLVALGPPRGLSAGQALAALGGLAAGLVGAALLPRPPASVVRPIALGLSAAGCVTVIARALA